MRWTKNKAAILSVFTLFLIVAFVWGGNHPKGTSSSDKGISQNVEEDVGISTEGEVSGGDGTVGSTTDPVPEGKPLPVEWQNVNIDEDTIYHCTLSVECKTILDHIDLLNPAKLEVLPEDGIIYAEKKIAFYDGESVFDVLQREMKKNKIHLEFEMTPIYNSNYIEGIHNIYEFDCGELSGWMYKVNDWFPNYGSSRYRILDGDRIQWIYTCDLGRDIGNDYMGEGSLGEGE